MENHTKVRSTWLGLTILILGVIPAGWYWFYFINAPGVTGDAARALLADTNAAPLLVDVRSVDTFAVNHIAGAVNLPYEKIASSTELASLWPGLQNRTCLLICDSGHLSVAALRHLKAMGYHQAKFVIGGMAAWQTIQGGKCLALNLHSMQPFTQWLAVITAFGIKPLYIVLAAVWIYVLRRQLAEDLKALKWGLIAFWLGEMACAVNYLAYAGRSEFWEFLHNYGMTVGFAFTAFAVLDGMDLRLIKVSAPKERCAVLSLCRECIKYSHVSCGMQRLFTWLIPAVMVVALVPFFATIRVISYNSVVLGGLVNYSNMVSSQLFELRYCPAIALIFLAISWSIMVLNKHSPVPMAKMFFAAALGPLGFGFIRLFLYTAFGDNLAWATMWEEWTELLYIMSVGAVLWLFRAGLFIQVANATRPDLTERPVS